MFNIREFKSGIYSGKVLEFELSEPIGPEDLPEIERQLPEISGHDVLVISGRGPIWLYGVILHRYMHLFPAVAVYDPKLGGAIIVVSHLKTVKVGTVIPLKL